MKKKLGGKYAAAKAKGGGGKKGRKGVPAGQAGAAKENVTTKFGGVKTSYMSRFMTRGEMDEDFRNKRETQEIFVSKEELEKMAFDPRSFIKGKVDESIQEQIDKSKAAFDTKIELFMVGLRKQVASEMESLHATIADLIVADRTRHGTRVEKEEREFGTAAEQFSVLEASTVKVGRRVGA